MSVLLRYLSTQFHRAIKVFPILILVTVLLAGGSVLAVQMMFHYDEDRVEKKKFEIGVVGNMEDEYLGFGLYAIKNLDSSRFVMELIPMTKEEAVTAMRQGTLSAYIEIPDGFMESVLSGGNKQITYATSNGAVDTGVIIFNEVVSVVSDLLTGTQAAIYGMQSFATEHGLTVNLNQAVYEMNMQYISQFMNRSNLFEIENLGISDAQSLTGYYLCGITILFFMLWGMNTASLMVRRDSSLARFLKAKNLPIWQQVLADYLVYISLFLLSMVVITAVLQAGLCFSGFQLTEWKREGSLAFSVWMGRLLPVMLMTASLQFLLYEAVSDIVSGVLLQFLVTAVLGYLSGCFYPVAFFPEIIQKTAGILPTGIALKYACHSMLSDHTARDVWGLFAYTIAFLLLSVCIRFRKVTR